MEHSLHGARRGAMKINSEYTNELTMAKEDAKENLE